VRGPVDFLSPLRLALANSPGAFALPLDQRQIMQSELYPKRCRPTIPQGEQTPPTYRHVAEGYNNNGSDVIPMTTRRDERHGRPGHNSDNPTWRADNDPDELSFDQIVARNQQHGIVLAHLNGALAVMVDPRCEPSHRIIYKELALHRNVFGISFPGFKRLAHLTEYSEGKVRNVISDLIQWKHIISDRRAPAAGGRALAHYTPTPRFGLDLEALLTAFAKELKAKGDQKSKRCSLTPSEPKPADVSLQGDVRSDVTHQGDVRGLMSPPQGDVRGLMSPCRVHSKVVVAVEEGTNASRNKNAQTARSVPGSLADETTARVRPGIFKFVTDEHCTRLQGWVNEVAASETNKFDRSTTERNLRASLEAAWDLVAKHHPEVLPHALERALEDCEGKPPIAKESPKSRLSYFREALNGSAQKLVDICQTRDSGGTRPALSRGARSPAKQARAGPIKPIDTEALRRAVEIEELGCEA
jgi:hypothetical protein